MQLRPQVDCGFVVELLLIRILEVDGQRGRQTDRQADRQRQTERDRDTERQKQIDTERDRETQRDTIF